MARGGRLALWAATAFFEGLELWCRFSTGLRAWGAKPSLGAGRIFSFAVNTIDGQPKPLSEYKGQVLMMVNTASLCGFTPQYESLEQVYGCYKEQGLRVLAFPANEFGKQEPGADSEIKEFCRTRYSLSFDLFSKICVRGSNIHPLYRFLTTESGFPGEIPWNFTKFLVDRQGCVAARFGPQRDPMSRAVRSEIERLLADKF